MSLRLVFVFYNGFIYHDNMASLMVSMTDYIFWVDVIIFVTIMITCLYGVKMSRCEFFCLNFVYILKRGDYSVISHTLFIWLISAVVMTT